MIENKPSDVCQVCGHPVKPEESTPWLTGVAHLGCKKKTEGSMRDESGTIYGHDHPPA